MYFFMDRIIPEFPAFLQKKCIKIGYKFTDKQSHDQTSLFKIVIPTKRNI